MSAKNRDIFEVFVLESQEKRNSAIPTFIRRKQNVLSE